MMRVELSSRDRLFVAGCLLRGLLDEAALARAVESMRDDGVPLARRLVDLGVIEESVWETFENRLRELEQDCSGRRVELKRVADAQIQQAIPVVRSPSLRKLLQGGEEPALQQRRTDVSFQLVKVIGEGGLGRVWLALDQQLQRQVAIKELRPELAKDGSLSRRFLREAQISASLQHPNIPSFFLLNGADHEQPPFLAMQRVSGITLHEEIEREAVNRTGAAESRRRYLREQIDHLLRVCDAIAFANSLGIVHRDLKPANVMLGQFGEVLVMDWGLAKRLAPDDAGNSAEPESIWLEESSNDGVVDELTQHDSILGSLPYIAPEQARGAGSAAGIATDVYGVGAILFVILTGRPPHVIQGKIAPMMFAQLIATSPTPLASSVDPRTEPALDAICAKAMAFEPERRYRSARALADDLQAWLDGERVSVHREQWPRRLARWLIRRPRTALSTIGLAAGVILILSTALCFAIFEYQVREERVSANVTAASATVAGRFADLADELRMASLILSSTIYAVSRDDNGTASQLRHIDAIVSEFLDHDPEAMRVVVFADQEMKRVLTVHRRNWPAGPHEKLESDDVVPLARPKLSNETELSFLNTQTAIGTRSLLVRAFADCRNNQAEKVIGPVLVEFDVAENLEQIVIPLLTLEGVRVLIADGSNQVVAEGRFGDGPKAKVGNLGDLYDLFGSASRYFDDPNEPALKVIRSSGPSQNVVVMRKIWLNPTPHQGRMGVVIEFSGALLLSAPNLQPLIVAAVVLGSLLGAVVILVIIVSRAVVRTASGS